MHITPPAPFTLQPCHDVLAALGRLGRFTQRPPSIPQVPVERLIAELRRLHSHLDSQLSATAPARRASMQQGAALARVASHWLAVGDALGDRASISRSREIASELHLGGRAHGAIVLGVLVALLELPAGAVELGLAHSSSRDLLSAAVRRAWRT